MKVEVLFPEICNLFGELANIRVIEESIDSATIIETHLTDEPRFVNQKVDLVYMGSTTERGQLLAIDKLKGYTDKIRKAIDDGVNFLITGNALEIFGKAIYEDDEHVADGLGILDIVARRSSINRYNSLYVGDFHAGEDVIKVVGFKSVFGFAYGEELENNLFDTTIGYGSNTDTSREGIRINNFYATYVIGPLLILNPLFAEWFFENVLGIKAQPAHYQAAMSSYETRLQEFTRPGKGWKY